MKCDCHHYTRKPHASLWLCVIFFLFHTMISIFCTYKEFYFFANKDEKAKTFRRCYAFFKTKINCKYIQLRKHRHIYDAQQLIALFALFLTIMLFFLWTFLKSPTDDLTNRRLWMVSLRKIIVFLILFPFDVNAQSQTITWYTHGVKIMMRRLD